MRLRSRDETATNPAGAVRPDPAPPSVPPPRRAGPARRVVSLTPALAGLGLGLLALGPGLGRGFLLSYDMVFVPRMPFSAALLGITGGPPRAAPSDAVVAIASRALPADVVQKVILLLIFVLACSGAAALLDSAWAAARRAGERAAGEAATDAGCGGAPTLARLAAGVCYAWNPYVAERLLIGQWALLLGYAALPWVVRVGCTGPERIKLTRLAGAMIPAAIGGFTAMSVTAVAAIPAALCGGRGRERARRLAVRARGGDPPEPPAHHPLGPACGRPSRLARLSRVLAALALLSLPWLIPALVVPVHTDPRGVDAFAARADTPFGRVGSLLMLSGIWNAQTVPRGYGGVSSVFWLLVVVASLAGFAFLVRPRRLRTGLGIAALAGLVIALLGVASPGRAALRDLVAAWPGFALLRDGQEYLAPLALAEAVGLGALVAWVIAAAVRAVTQPGRATAGATRSAAAALGAMAVLAPVLLLPGMAWGMAGRLRPVEYPAGWLTARQIIDGDPGPGSVLLLPWAAYRRYPWNGGEAVFDPWARFTGREVIASDALDVGSMTVAQESTDSIRLGRIVGVPGPLTRALRSAGVRYVIVDAGPLLRRADRGLAAAARLPGARVMIADSDLILFRLPT